MDSRKGPQYRSSNQDVRIVLVGDSTTQYNVCSFHSTELLSLSLSFPLSLSISLAPLSPCLHRPPGGVGKSTLIMSLVREQFVPEVPYYFAITGRSTRRDPSSLDFPSACAHVGRCASTNHMDTQGGSLSLSPPCAVECAPHSIESFAILCSATQVFFF